MKSGILLLDKPAGMTSFDCIRQLKKILQTRDIGHGGTLDKFATGLLPILLGDGLKLVRFFLESYPTLPTYWKTYKGTLHLGVETETGDAEGTTTKEQSVELLSLESVQSAMNSFVGAPYLQTPPRFSAKKISGVRASDLARQGEEVEMKPVPVFIERLTCLSVRQNEIDFEVTCSKGTYVRVLAQDLAKKLGTVAHVKALRRSAVGTFDIEKAVSLENLSQTDASHKNDPWSFVLSMDEATSFLPLFELMSGETDLIRKGKVVDVVTRLANSGLKPNVYCGKEIKNGVTFPAALLELKEGYRANFIRAL